MKIWQSIIFKKRTDLLAIASNGAIKMGYIIDVIFSPPLWDISYEIRIWLIIGS